jgi:uncharacterized protein YgbK (DUF1537 family)
MDAGVQAKQHGARIGVVLDHAHLKEMAEDADFIVLDTESRNRDAASAFQCVSDSVLALDSWGARLAYKKIDSTLRGNVGAEISAVLASRAGRIALVAPALPFNGRVTRGGVQYVGGVELAATEPASDPFAPVRHSSIREIILSQTDTLVREIGLSTVRQGPGAVATDVLNAFRDRCRVIVTDAETDADLLSISMAVSSLDTDVVPCGSAGLFGQMWDMLSTPARTPGRPDAEGLSQERWRQAEAREKEAHPRRQWVRQSRSGPVIAVTASPSAVSRAQVDVAGRMPGKHLVLVDENRLFAGGEAREHEVARVREETERAIGGSADVVIAAQAESKKQLLERYRDDRRLLLERSRTILECLARIVRATLELRYIRGLALIGGDTAAAICAGLCVYGIEIMGEVEPYVPAGSLRGGVHDRLAVVTKAGGFGNESSLARMIDYLHSL